MARRSLGATYQREKKKYTQKLTKKTKDRVKHEKKNKPNLTTPGSRVGTTVRNESRDRVKSALKSALKSDKSVSKTHLNQALGGRAGSKTERLELKSYDTYKSDKGLTNKDTARKQEYQRATSYQGNRAGKNISESLKSGFYSNKNSDKERAKSKERVYENVQKGYNKKAENGTAAFLAGLTKSNKTQEVASKKLLDKQIDTSKVTKKGAYKAGDTVQELASYFIAPTEAAGEKLIAKGIEKGAKKILKKELKEVGRKEVKAKMKDAIVKDAIKTGSKGINKGAKAEKAFTNRANKAVKSIKDDAVRKAVRESGKKVTAKQRFLARRGGDVIANTPFNAKYAVDRNTDEKGNVNWKGAAADYALNTGLDIGIGGGIDSAVGKVRKVKAENAERVAKAEKKIKEINTKKATARAKRAEERAVERELAKEESTIKSGAGKGQKKKSKKSEVPKRRREQEVKYNPAQGKAAVKGKKVRNASELDSGETVKSLSKRIDDLEAEGKITPKEAKKQRKALIKASENVTGGRVIAERSGDFSRLTKKGLEKVSDSEYGGRSLTFDKRFKGTAKRIGEVAESKGSKKLAEKYYSSEGKIKRLVKAEKALDEQIEKATGKEKSLLQRFKDKVIKRKTAEEAENARLTAENAEVKEIPANAKKTAKKGDWTEGIPTLDEELSTEEKLRANVKEQKKELSNYTSAQKENVKHTGKKDDTITAKESPSMAEVDSAYDMTPETTTHTENLTKEGKARGEKKKASQAEKEALEEQYGKEVEGKIKADKEATRKQHMKEIDEEALGKREPQKSESAPSKETKSNGVSAPPKESSKADLNKASTNFRRKFIDSMGFTERQAQKFAKDNKMPEFGKKVTGDINNLRQATQQAGHSLEKEQLDVHGNKVGRSGYEIIRDMDKRGTHNDVYDYLLNMHHADRVDNAKKKIDGEYIKINGKDADKRVFSDKTPEKAREEAKEIFEKYKAEGRGDEFMRDVGEVVRYFRNDLRSQMLSGVISEDTFRHYINTYPNYVPTHRVGAGSLTRPKVNSKSAVEHVAKGADTDVLPLAYQMQISTNNTFTRSAMNDVARDIADMHNVPREAYDFMSSSGVEPIDTMTFFDANDGKLRFTENGEWKEINVDKNFVKDLEDSQANYFKDSMLMKAFTKGNSIFKALITSYSPTFMIRNFIRDVPEGWFQSQNMRLNMKNMPSGFKSIVTNDDWYRAYVRQGGSHAQFVEPGKVFSHDWKLLKPLEKLERLNEITEQIPRMAEFRAYLEKLGVTPQTATVDQLRQASHAAADVTVNFGRSGSIGRLINKSIIPFFNPAIQGSSKFARVLTQDKSVTGYLKLLGKVATLGVAPTVLNEMLLEDDKYYKQIPERDRAINYYVPLDADNPLAKLFGSKEVEAKDGEIFLKIPKARVLSVFGEGAQKAMGKLPDSSLIDLVGIGADQVGPVGWSNNIGMQIYNAHNNKTWYGTPIENTKDQYVYKDGERTDKPFHKRYDANTSSWTTKFAKGLYDATGIDVSPKRLDYLIDSYTGVAGDIYLSKTKKAAQRGYWAKAFTTDATMQANIPSKYYEKLSSSETSSKDRKAMKQWKDRINFVDKAIKQVQNSDSKEKEAEVHALTRYRNKLMQNAIDGKENKTPANDIKAVANALGKKRAFDMTADKSDKKALERYGKGDDKFYDSYVAMKEISNGKNTSRNTKAVAIASAGGGKKVAKAFGLTDKKEDDMSSPYERAKTYIKNGGSIEEYKRIQKAAKDVKGKGTDDYMNKAYAMAKIGASDRAYALYDVKESKVQRARDMAATGITPKEMQKHRTNADPSGHPTKAEIQSYVGGLKASKEKKSVIYDSLAYWRNNGNPYGHVTASAKDAEDKPTKAKYSAKPTKTEKPSPVPLKSGYQKNGNKTIGSVGDRVMLPAGRTADELKRDEKAGKIKREEVVERLHNAFGSRIGDTTKKKVYKATSIKDIKKNKDNSIDITFANGDVWHNPSPKGTAEDNTALETSGGGSGKGGRRGYRRGWRRYGRYGRSGGGGGGSTSTTPLKLKKYEGTPKRIKSKAKTGLTKAQLKDIMKMAVILENAPKARKQSAQDIYKIRGGKK